MWGAAVLLRAIARSILGRCVVDEERRSTHGWCLTQLLADADHSRPNGRTPTAATYEYRCLNFTVLDGQQVRECTRYTELSENITTFVRLNQ